MSEYFNKQAHWYEGRVLADRYVLKRLLGQGGQCQVWLAEDLRLKRAVAVKMLRTDRGWRSGVLERFLLEAEITAQLNHPGIPSVHDLGFLDDDMPFLVMRIVEGQTLKEIVEKVWGQAGHLRQPAQEEIAKLLAIFEQVCQTLGYAHSQGVIHRDLKPSNVMVGAHGEVQVMDWGLAKNLKFRFASEPQPISKGAVLPETVQMDNVPENETSDWGSGVRTETGTVLGTPAYMPPEQAAGEIGKLDARSDVFGLGAMLCEMLTGQPPYVGTSAHEVRLQAVRWQIQPAWERLDRSPASSEWIAVCKRCLSFSPEDRFSDAAALAETVVRLRQAAEQRAQQAERERTAALVRENEQRKRRRLLLSLGGALLAVMAMATVLVSWKWKEANRAAEAERLARLETQQRHEIAEYHRQRAEQALLAEQQARHAEQSARRAEHRAREAVLKVLSEFTDDSLDNFLLQVTEWSETEQAFLERISKHFNTLAQVRGEDVPSRRLRAEGFLRLGIIQYRLRHLQEAESALHSAISQLEALLEYAPGEVTTCKSSLAKACLVLGYVYRYQYRISLSWQAYCRGWQLNRELVEKQPHDIPILNSYALSCRLVAGSLDLRGQPQLADCALLDALDACQRALTLAPESSNAKLRYAELLRQLASRFLESGRHHEAESFARMALALSEELWVRSKQSALALSTLAESYELHARCLKQLGRSQEAEQEIVTSVDMCRRLASDFPANPRYQETLADALVRYSLWLRQNRNNQESETLFQEALSLRESLARRYPQVPHYSRELASIYSIKAIRLVNARRYDVAEQYYLRSVQIYQDLVERYPDWPTVREDLARNLERLGRLLVLRKRYSEALERFREAQARIESLYAKLPFEVNYRHWLGLLQTLQAEALLASNAHGQQARDHLEQAQRLLLSALEAQPRDQDYRSDWRRLLGVVVLWECVQGQHVASCNVARQIAQLGYDVADDAYAAAAALSKAHSWLAEHRAHDPNLEDVLEQLGQTAVAILRSAVQDLQHSPERLAAFTKRLQSSAQLRAIRLRADFQELLQALPPSE